MKKLIHSIIGLMLSATVFAQAPQSFKYQAVARDASGEVVANQHVSFQISILQGNESGTAVYMETHVDSTNQFGLITLEIGTGTTTDDFTAIDWDSDAYFIQIEMDASGGTSYILMGTSQLLSVPYALHAKTAANITATDITNLGNLSGTNTGDQDLSTLALKSNVIELDNTTAFTPDANYEPATKKYVDDNTNEQALALNDFYLSISGGNEILLPTLWEVVGSSIFYNDGKASIGGSENGIQLELPDLFSAGGKNLMIGDDAYLSDVDMYNTLGIYGASDSSSGAIQLGSEGPLLSGKDNNLIVSGEIESATGGIRFPDSSLQSTAIEYQTMQHVLEEGNDAGYMTVHNLLIGQCEICDSATSGCIRFDTVSSKLQYCDGETWQIIISTSEALPSDGIFVSPMGMDTAGSGAINASCKTIGFGIGEASSQGYTKIFIANGTYNETITLVDGINLAGGYDPDTWIRNENSTATMVFGTSNISSHPVTIMADGISTDISIERLILFGQDAINGLNSYGIYIKNSTGTITLNNNIIHNGNGGNGSNGATGNGGIDGVDGQGRTDGSLYDAFETGGAPCNTGDNRQINNGGSRTIGVDDVSGGRGGGNVCPPSAGSESSGIDGSSGQWGGGALGGGGGTGGDAGDDGEIDGACYLPGNPMTGLDGQHGGSGANGAMGMGAGTNQGTLVSFHWVGINGSSGADGGNSGGGGGGGAGGGAEYTSGFPTNDLLGGHGGGGGSGAAGGGAGPGGLAGGGSFGIFILDSTAPVIEHTTIFRGNGGNGGNGGSGGPGGSGGNGGDGGQCSGSCFCVGAAGSGGSGGDGGHGGGGGGASGGLSIGIYTSNITGLPDYTGVPANNMITGGTGGQKGYGGISYGESGTDGIDGYLTDVIYN